LVWFLVWFG